jgi:hypothetical protein
VDKSPPNYYRQLYFHYVLDLNEAGEIRGGRFYCDSAQIDMLWVPLKPAQGGEEKNRRGNPHLKVKEVLAIWRQSVSEDLRKKWLNIDPTEEDRVLPPVEAIAAENGATPPAAESAVAVTANSEDTTASALAGSASSSAGSELATPAPASSP